MNVKIITELKSIFRKTKLPKGKIAGQMRACPMCNKVTRFHYDPIVNHGACKKCGFYIPAKFQVSLDAWYWIINNVNRIRADYNKNKTTNLI